MGWGRSSKCWWVRTLADEEEQRDMLVHLLMNTHTHERGWQAMEARLSANPRAVNCLEHISLWPAPHPVRATARRFTLPGHLSFDPLCTQFCWSSAHPMVLALQMSSHQRPGPLDCCRPLVLGIGLVSSTWPKLRQQGSTVRVEHEVSEVTFSGLWEEVLLISWSQWSPPWLRHAGTTVQW